MDGFERARVCTPMQETSFTRLMAAGDHRRFMAEISTLESHCSEGEQNEEFMQS